MMELGMCIQRFARSYRYLTGLMHSRSLHHPSGIYKWTPPEQKIETNTPPGYEITNDPEEFKFVDRLAPLKLVPAPPKHSSYPTPSGWVPQKGSKDLPYFVNRSRYHQLPVYHQRVLRGGTRQVTIVRNVDGDLWALEADLRKHLESMKKKKVYTQVHELGRFVRVKGIHLEEIAEYLLSKGF